MLSAMKRRRAAAAVGDLGLVGALTGCFPDGMWVIGSGGGHVAPALYTSNVRPGGNCQVFIERVGAVSFQEQQTAGRSFIDIPSAQSGSSVVSQGCGPWVTPQARSYNPDRATARYGEYRVPTDLLTGTYVAPGAPGCAWQLVSSFNTGDASALLSSGSEVPGHQPRVHITTADKGFSTSPCGGWRRIGP
jgi:hypothetical protein